jgi:hypothetical protein
VESEQPPPTTAAEGRRGQVQFFRIALFDVGGPLAVYYALTSSGVSAVVALVVSGVVPAFGIGLGLLSHRHIDAIGIVVLFGIVVGTIAGLVSGSPRLVLLDGTVPTAVIGVVFLASLGTPRPLMFRFALESMGPDTPRGRDFAAKWQYREFRHIFAVISVVWALAFLAETVAQVVIVEQASASTAKTTANLLPVAVAAVLVAWTFSYGRHQQRRGERAAASSAAVVGDGQPA